jgi:hypothetical protein
MAVSALGHPVPRFLTYKQVRKGEHGYKVYFVNQLAARDTADSDIETEVERSHRGDALCPRGPIFRRIRNRLMNSARRFL